MTEKQETILTVALRLFASQGYENTPTSQIAKEAGVSEGLIFRHFENKDGLLRALIADGQARVQVLMDRIAQETDSKKILARTIDLPLTLISEEREFWTLQFILKYNNKYAAALKAESDYYGTLIGAVEQAFATLNYSEPKRETELLILLLEGFGSSLLMQGDSTDPSALIHFIKSKYNV
ncbi:TetR/AcrR family transcriptional regulator [Spirosoma arcticum]